MTDLSRCQVVVGPFHGGVFLGKMVLSVELGGFPEKSFPNQSSVRSRMLLASRTRESKKFVGDTGWERLKLQSNPQFWMTQ